MRSFNYTVLTGTILLCCGYMWRFNNYLLINQYFKNLLLVLCCIVTSSPIIYIYIACNFELKLGKGYVHVCICTCTGNDRQLVKGRKKLHCLSPGRHDFNIHTHSSMLLLCTPDRICVNTMTFKKTYTMNMYVHVQSQCKKT